MRFAMRKLAKTHQAKKGPCLPAATAPPSRRDSLLALHGLMLEQVLRVLAGVKGQQKHLETQGGEELPPSFQPRVRLAALHPADVRMSDAGNLGQMPPGDAQMAAHRAELRAGSRLAPDRRDVGQRAGHLVEGAFKIHSLLTDRGPEKFRR